LSVPARAVAAPSSPTPAPSPTPRSKVSPTVAPTASPTPAAIATATPIPEAWVQALRSLPLWSGPDDNAQQFGFAARWDYFLIVPPQMGQRLQVLVARTKNYAWVDALSVGPSGPPPPGWPPADLGAPPDDLSVGWVATATDVPLWSDSDATLFVGVYDDRTRQLHFVNCGHPAPLLLRRDGTTERLDATGWVIGMFDEWKGTSREVTLLEGDVIALYTDGVTETVDGGGEEFGEKRLEAVLKRHHDSSSPPALVDDVIAAVQAFGAAEQFDDITVIVGMGK